MHLLGLVGSLPTPAVGRARTMTTEWGRKGDSMEGKRGQGGRREWERRSTIAPEEGVPWRPSVYPLLITGPSDASTCVWIMKTHEASASARAPARAAAPEAARGSTRLGQSTPSPLLHSYHSHSAAVLRGERRRHCLNATAVCGRTKAIPASRQGAFLSRLPQKGGGEQKQFN